MSRLCLMKVWRNTIFKISFFNLLHQRDLSCAPRNSADVSQYGTLKIYIGPCRKSSNKKKSIPISKQLFLAANNNGTYSFDGSCFIVPKYFLRQSITEARWKYKPLSVVSVFIFSIKPLWHHLSLSHVLLFLMEIKYPISYWLWKNYSTYFSFVWGIRIEK